MTMTSLVIMITINVVTIVNSDNHGNGDNGDDENCHDNDVSINYVSCCDIRDRGRGSSPFITFQQFFLENC